MRVALFIPCFVDQFFPQVGKAMVQVLRRLKIEPEFPADQTCCGQPAFNTGYWDEARPLAQQRPGFSCAPAWFLLYKFPLIMYNIARNLPRSTCNVQRPLLQVRNPTFNILMF